VWANGNDLLKQRQHIALQRFDSEVAIGVVPSAHGE